MHHADKRTMCIVNYMVIFKFLAASAKVTLFTISVFFRSKYIISYRFTSFDSIRRRKSYQTRRELDILLSKHSVILFKKTPSSQLEPSIEL